MGRALRPFASERCGARYPKNALASTLPPARGPGYERTMTARVRKLIGSVGVLVFLAAYVLVITKLSDHVPKHWAAQLAYYLVAGLGWGVPIMPLIRWMNRGR
jgi:hypothetical protein